MTEKQIKEMLNGIINNGEKWEGRHSVQVNKSIDFPEYEWSNWQSYKLGEEIHEDWEYRKVETWLEEYMEIQGGRPFLPSCSDYEKKKICFKNGATEVCKKILEEIKSRYYADKDTVSILEDIIKDLGI